MSLVSVLCLSARNLAKSCTSIDPSWASDQGAAVANELSPSAFANVLRLASPLVVDIRPFFLYESNHANGAVNISLPRALLSKKPTTMDRVEGLIIKEEDKSRFRERRQRVVVVYENGDVKSGSPAHSLIKLLEREGQCAAIYVLQGGFASFARQHPELCSKSFEDDGGKVEQSCSSYFGGIPCHVADGAPTEIVGGVYLGSGRNAADLSVLVTLNIKGVLNMALECSNHFPHQFEYKNVGIYDDPNIDAMAYFEEAADWIGTMTASVRAVLVHCFMGISRSAAAVIAYLMKHRRMALQDAYSLVKRLRPIVCPNSGFMTALIRYEKRLFGKISLHEDEFAPLVMMARWDDDAAAAAAHGSGDHAATTCSGSAAAALPPPPTVATAAVPPTVPPRVRVSRVASGSSSSSSSKAMTLPPERLRPALCLRTDLCDDVPPETPRALRPGQCAFAFSSSSGSGSGSESDGVAATHSPGDAVPFPSCRAIGAGAFGGGAFGGGDDDDVPYVAVDVAVVGATISIPAAVRVAITPTTVVGDHHDAEPHRHGGDAEVDRDRLVEEASEALKAIVVLAAAASTSADCDGGVLAAARAVSSDVSGVKDNVRASVQDDGGVIVRDDHGSSGAKLPDVGGSGGGSGGGATAGVVSVRGRAPLMVPKTCGTRRPPAVPPRMLTVL